MPFDSNGKWVPSTALDFKTDMRAHFESILGPNDWESDFFATEIINATAQKLGDATEGQYALVLSRSPSASGSHLAELGAVVGLPQPDLGAPSTVTLTLTAWATRDVFVPAGTLQVSGGSADSPSLWVTSEDVTVPAGTTATVVAECTEIGAVLAAIGTITNISRPVAGITAVTNAAAASPGRAAETPDDYALKFYSAGNVAGLSSPDALRTYLMALDGIIDVRIVENLTLSDTTLSTVTVPLRSVTPVIYPDSLTETQKDTLAKAIYSKTLGKPTALPSGSYGETWTVTGKDGLSKQVGWFWAQAKTVKVKVVVEELEPGYAFADVEDAIADAITAFFALSRSVVPLGGKVYIDRVAGAVTRLPGVADVTVSLSTNSGGSWVTTNVTIADNEYVSLETSVVEEA